MNNIDHQHYMRRALELAARGGRATMPNPMVGAVLVADGAIVGEGYHARCGGPHAEVHAIHSVTDHTLLQRATLYVTLEPCAHFGKTPPCADLVISSKIPHVVVACRDPFPEVSGRGIQKLIDAGITVTENVCHDDAIVLNRRFIVAHREKRPYVVLKWAQTSDGFIARDDLSSKWISCEASRVTTHRWRSEEMAILVGTTTARVDNPELTVRHVSGENPMRVTIDRHLTLPATHHLCNEDADTIILNDLIDEKRNRCRFKKLTPSLPPASAVLHALHDEGIISLIVEGGRHTLMSFIESGLWDEARVFVSPETFTSGVSAPALPCTAYAERSSGTDSLRLFQNPALINRLGVAACDLAPYVS